MSTEAVREWNKILEGIDLSTLRQRLEQLSLVLDLGNPFPDFVGRSTGLSQALMEYLNRVDTEYVEEIIYYLLEKYPVDQTTVQDYVSHCPNSKIVEEVLKRWEGGKLTLHFIGIPPRMVEVVLGFEYVDLMERRGGLTLLESLLAESKAMFYRGLYLTKDELDEVIRLMVSAGSPPPCFDTIQQETGIEAFYKS